MMWPTLADASATVASRVVESTPCGLLSSARAAAWLSVSPQALKRWRHEGGGPPFVRFSHKTIRYRIDDLEAFVISHVRASTANG
jgi:hypothetical protein